MSGPGDRPQDLSSALRDLRRTLAATRTELARVRGRPTTTPEERAALQDRALSGALGPGMETLARHVRSGRTTWPDVFHGVSPDADLLRDHLARMLAEHHDDVRRALAADPGFDPLAPHEGVG
jgi:hypothetical protein